MPAPGDGDQQQWERSEQEVRPYLSPQPLDAELLERRVVRLWGRSTTRPWRRPAPK